MIDADGRVDLHPVGRGLDDGVGRADDVLGGAEVLHQVALLCLVVGFEAADELDAGVAEAVDVLVVVAHRHDGELGVAVLAGAAGQRAHQSVLERVDVLVLVDQDEAIAFEQPVAQLVGVGAGLDPALQEIDRVLQHRVEIGRLIGLRQRAQADPGQPQAPWRDRSGP